METMMMIMIIWLTVMMIAGVITTNVKLKYSLKRMCCHQLAKKHVSCWMSWGLNIRKFIHVKMIAFYTEMNIKTR
jgi:hypothetical protein